MAAAGVPVLPGVTVAPGRRRSRPQAATDRLPGAGQGRVRRRRPRHAARRATRPSWPPPSPAPRREAAAAFGDGTVFLERYVDRPPARRGADPRRRARQRRPPLRARVLDPAAPPEDRRGVARRRPSTTRCAPSCARPRSRAGRAIGYTGAGTVEFVLDAAGAVLLPRGQHPAAGRAPGHRAGHRARPGRAAAARSPRASRCPAEVTQRRGSSGHAIEVRLYAEDVPAGFLPATGTLHRFQRPGRRRACGSTRASRRARSSARTTTRCWPRSSRTAPPAAEAARRPGARAARRPASTA